MALSADSGANPDPDAGPAEGTELLPCGRTLQEVWDAWDEDRATGDPHYAACPHCTAALHGLRMLDDFVRTARTADEEERRADGRADGARTADAVTGRVMDIVRRELRPGRSLPLGEPDEEAWIVEAAAARAFRSAVDGLRGVRAGSCRIVPQPAEAVVRVRVEVAADLSRGFPELADAVRDRIVTAARDVVGLEVAAVDVAVVDVLVDGGWERAAADLRGLADAEDER
ncbi:hypothetical protein E4198_12195 [Streptomyces sp. RKND-216]|uniref:hypothetical protein n=1 Tax=Streptomyces sp. RKND-216 TaxID=2562581 RepID=UPI00109E1609|nr:hypothetical protein [Streptomyces sp. RKND-216]THA25378.1 hypothetical protein E4198_12195 [Streptomyces sp. RKND-216]